MLLERVRGKTGFGGLQRTPRKRYWIFCELNSASALPARIGTLLSYG
jgi:hypothetical protein